MTHWDNQAKQWALLGSPLKPSPIDMQNSCSWINKYKQSHRLPLTVLVLGVTPELVNIAWPEHTTLFAIDYSMLMIQAILPANASVKPRALLGNWLQLPLSDESIDIVIGDGCYSSLAGKDYANLSAEIRRVLKPTGLMIMRFFSRPDHNESMAIILDDLASGKISNFHAFKLRLAMALHDDLQQGVCLKKIWNDWEAYFKNDAEKHMQKLKWCDEVIGSINTYKDSDVFYTFPTYSEIQAILSQHFIENEVFVPEYDLGLRCPTF